MEYGGSRMEDLSVGRGAEGIVVLRRSWQIGDRLQRGGDEEGGW